MATACTFLGFIEQIAFGLNDQLDAVATLQVSPANHSQYWQIAAMHPTHKTASIVGATVTVLNPLADAATNPIQANITGENGLRCVVDWGAANAEYVTVLGVTPTSTGYTGATLQIGTCVDVATRTTGTGLRHAHAADAT